MTHPTLQPLMILLEQAERDRDDALARHCAAQATAQAALNQQQQLDAYREETQTRWGQQFRGGVTMTLMNCYHDFVGRLHGAVEQQTAVVERHQSEVARCQDDILAAELRVASVRKLIERREAVLQRGVERGERRQEDEFANRATWVRLQDEGAAPIV